MRIGLPHVLNLEFHEVDRSNDPAEFQAYYKEWKHVQEHWVAFGWVPSVSDEERLSTMVAARLFQHLLRLINEDLRDDGDSQDQETAKLISEPELARFSVCELVFFIDSHWLANVSPVGPPTRFPQSLN